MAFTLPNIYTSKNVKYFVLIPIALMLVSIYLSSTGLVLDTSLSGGASIIIQTNTTMSAQQLASQISSKLGVVSPSVVVSKGQVSITIPKSKNLDDAEGSLTSVYTYRANYSIYLINETNARILLQKDPNNQTLLSSLAKNSSGANRSVAGLITSLNAELVSLRPYIGNISYNSSNIDSMISTASNSYQNASNVYKQNVIASLHQILQFSSYSYQQITGSQSRYFISKLFSVIEIAFVLIIIVVFIIFRSPIPSIAIVFGAANDIIVALGAMAVFKIPLGIASIGGLLMLLGYSIDTDVLTAIRILKRHEGAPEDRAYSSMKTGLTMTITAIVSFAVLFAVSLIEYVPTYYEIAGVALFGLIGDIITTWLGNVPMILTYVKRRRRI